MSLSPPSRRPTATAQPVPLALPPRAPAADERLFWVSLGVTALVKLVLAALIPLTADEAYFLQWGRQPGGGYYDHGGMTGWWIGALLAVSGNLWWIRLSAALTTLLGGLVVWRILRPLDPSRAALAATCYLWSPVNLLGVLITTDTPLIFFSLLAGACAVRADRTDRAVDYLATGALLGLAFLAKYFAVLFGLGLAVAWLLLTRPPRPRAVLWVLAGVLPFAAQHVYWNSQHGWVTILFNLFNRQSDAELSLGGPLLFLVLAAYLFGPVLVLWFRRPPAGAEPGAGWGMALESPAIRVPLALFLVPYAVYFLVSFVQPVGLHWLLSFYPFAYAALMIGNRPVPLHRAVKPMIIYGAIHLAVIGIVLALPVELARSSRSYQSIVLVRHPQETLEALRPIRSSAVVATPSYAKSALLEYFLGEPVPVLGPGSYHGRQDDLRTDFRRLDGQDILLLSHRPSDLERARPWFQHADEVTVTVRGAEFHLLRGRGFLYERYRDEVLQPVADRYYRVPGWLRRLSDRSPFLERYGLRLSDESR